MGSRVFILLGLMLAIVLLISSEVEAAKDLAAKTSNTKEETTETNGVEESKYGGYGGGRGGYGGGRGGYGGGQGGYGGGRGGYGGGQGGYGGGRGGYGGGQGGHGGGRGCRYGCCGGRGYYGGGCRCCTYAGEAKDAQTTAEPQN